MCTIAPSSSNANLGLFSLHPLWFQGCFPPEETNKNLLPGWFWGACSKAKVLAWVISLMNIYKSDCKIIWLIQIDAIYLPIISQCLRGWILLGEDSANYKSCCIICKTHNRPLWDLKKRREERGGGAVERPSNLRFSLQWV